MTPTHTPDHVNPEAATTERPVFGNPLGTPSIYYPRHYRKTTLASGRGLGKTNPLRYPLGATVWRDGLERIYDVASRRAK
jgi:hypothetical protein